MKSVSFSKSSFNYMLYYEAWTAVTQYRYYFRKVSRGDTDELMISVFEHIISHYRPECGALVPYMIKLAQTMCKSNGRFVACDFLEDTLTDELDKQASKSGTRSDLVDSVFKILDTSEEKYTAIAELALSYMNFFNLLCESIVNRNSATRYFPEPFTNSCLSLVKRCGGEWFNQTCLHIYNKYKTQFSKFMSSSTGIESSWRELDKGLIDKNSSKRIKLVCKGTNTVCDNPDKDPWEVKGLICGKRVLKVPYLDLYDKVIDYIEDDEVNPLKFTLGTSYICRSLGGSLSVLNVNLFRQYEIFRLELITNLIYDLGARFLSFGSECVYMLITPDETGKIKTIPKRNIRGIEVNLEAIDVTPNM